MFVNSMSEIGHARVPEAFVARIFATMALGPQHQFQVLTKRRAGTRGRPGAVRPGRHGPDGRGAAAGRAPGQSESLIARVPTPGHGRRLSGEALVAGGGVDGRAGGSRPRPSLSSTWCPCRVPGEAVWPWGPGTT
ncbi:DUF5131 family protein [Streptomyces phaeofaciens]|uniref:DUF5131 family protein n=1 Tax=Streptomyces phaeofaciens TaxID=68254 RepID=UPI003679FD43